MKNILEITKEQILAKAKKVRLCRSSGIYILMDQGEIVYVGQSVACEVRIATHAYEAKKMFDAYTILPVKNPHLDYIERKLIETFLPKYNNDWRTCVVKGAPGPRRTRPDGASSTLAKPLVTPLGYFPNLRSAAVAHGVSHQAIASKIKNQSAGWSLYSEIDYRMPARHLRKPGRKPKV